MQPLQGNLTGFKAYRALLAMAFEHKSYFFLGFIGMLVFAASDAGFAYLMKPMLDEGFIERDPFIIKLIPAAIVSMFLVRMVAVFLRTYCMDYIGRNVINSLRQNMFEKLLTLNSLQYDQSPPGEITTRFSYDVEKVAHSVSTSLTVLIQDTLRIIALLGYMTWLSWKLTAIFLTIGPIVFLIVVKVSSRFRRISRNIQASMGKVAEVAQEVIDANRVVKIFGGEACERNKFGKINQHNLKLNLKMSVAQATSTPLLQLIVAIVFAAIVIFATAESMHGVISTGDFVSFIFALTMLFAPMRSLSTVNANIQQGIAAGESIFSFIASADEVDDGELTLDRAHGALAFDQVVLYYREGGRRVLDEISFNIEPGQTVAIVGRSGSGKSSLVNLLPRLYELDSGSIRLDGEPINHYQLKALRRQIAYVGQDVSLFNDTVRHNIAYGMTAVDDEQIIEAARQAYAWDFIKALPAGLDTLLGEHGLSGGQRQRLAIARALLKNAPILILDEATSALDVESERYIQLALKNLMNNRTTLVIAHRLSTIEHADQILVLDEGRLVEQGTHASLLAQAGIYARLHALQFHDAVATETSTTKQTTPGQRQPFKLGKNMPGHWIHTPTEKLQGWWLWSINPISILLMPLALVFYGLANLRRSAYRLRLLKSTQLPVTTIVVGNITLGGNGKTPVVIALLKLLQRKGYQPAIITRGYKSGNEAKQQFLQDGQINTDVGDEANMISEICHCPIGIGADRVTVAYQLLEKYPRTDILLSDDGLQHYALQRDIEIAVCRYLAFGNGLLIPAGPLRESRNRLKSFDLVINRDGDEITELFNYVWNLAEPDRQRHITEFRNQQVHALAGIGFPDVFFASLKQVGIHVIEHEFPDHHEFTARDIALQPDLPILVTHKDAVKLHSINHDDIWVVPLQLELSQNLQNQLLQLLERKHHG